MTNLWPIFKETIKVKKTNKSYQLVETRHLQGDYAKEISEYLLVNMNLSKIKIKKIEITKHIKVKQEKKDQEYLRSYKGFIKITL